MICGADEAGRGPFIGPMVMATVMVESEEDLPEGLKDSKLLTPARREQLYKEVIKLPHAIRVCEPAEIDVWVFQGKLNWLEAEKTAEMLNELGPDRAIIDCPSRNLESYKEYIQQRAPDIELVVEHKADLNHRIVAAASILAKVTRDRFIKALREQAGFDFGSGYLTDPKTQSFLKDFDPDFKHFRKSWSTYKVLVADKEQKKLL